MMYNPNCGFCKVSADLGGKSLCCVGKDSKVGNQVLGYDKQEGVGAHWNTQKPKTGYTTGQYNVNPLLIKNIRRNSQR